MSFYKQAKSVLNRELSDERLKKIQNLYNSIVVRSHGPFYKWSNIVDDPITFMWVVKTIRCSDGHDYLTDFSELGGDNQMIVKKVKKLYVRVMVLIELDNSSSSSDSDEENDSSQEFKQRLMRCSI